MNLYHVQLISAEHGRYLYRKKDVFFSALFLAYLQSTPASPLTYNSFGYKNDDDQCDHENMFVHWIDFLWFFHCPSEQNLKQSNAQIRELGSGESRFWKRNADISWAWNAANCRGALRGGGAESWWMSAKCWERFCINPRNESLTFWNSKRGFLAYCAYYFGAVPYQTLCRITSINFARD